MSFQQKPAIELILSIMTGTGAAVVQTVKGLSLTAQTTTIPVLMPWQEMLHVGQSAIIGSLVGSVIGFFAKRMLSRYSKPKDEV